MKRLILGAAVAAGAAFAARRLADKARTMRDHCREMMAGHQHSKPAASPGRGT
jgi:hypothetical protein